MSPWRVPLAVAAGLGAGVVAVWLAGVISDGLTGDRHIATLLSLAVCLVFGGCIGLAVSFSIVHPDFRRDFARELRRQFTGWKDSP